MPKLACCPAKHVSPRHNKIASGPGTLPLCTAPQYPAIGIFRPLCMLDRRCQPTGISPFVSISSISARCCQASVSTGTSKPCHRARLATRAARDTIRLGTGTFPAPDGPIRTGVLNNKRAPLQNDKTGTVSIRVHCASNTWHGSLGWPPRSNTETPASIA